ncbi:flagellar export protein FliJ [Paenibacillus sp. CMAA1364]
MRFDYAFQNIVDLKGNQKTQAEWMLSNAIAKLREEEDSLRELENLRIKMMNQLQHEFAYSASVVKVQAIHSYVEHLEQNMVKKHEDIRKADVVVRNSQGHLTEKMLDEKVWMKSREKAKGKFQHDMQLREQNELDEIATVRFAMNHR